MSLFASTAEAVELTLALFRSGGAKSGTASLANLEKWLNELDNNVDKPLRLKDMAFQKSYNKQLGFGKDSKDPTVFMPWGSWENTNTDHPAPLQKALREVIQFGFSDTEPKPFIDLASLMPQAKFFPERSGSTDSEGKPVRDSVVDAIIDFVNGCGENTGPVIRFLIGDDSKAKREDTWHDNQTFFTDLFWPVNDQGKRVRQITHPRARLYVGYYNPDFRPSPDSPIITFIQNLQQRVTAISPLLGRQLKTFNAKEIQSVLEAGVRSISWNHAKIAAVNGKIVMTGGGNYWDAYAAKDEAWVYQRDEQGNVKTAAIPNDPGSLELLQERKRIDHDIVDHSIRVIGDAAVSAHKWSDYFWDYLSNPADTDKTSIWWGTRLDDDEPTWYTPFAPDSEDKSSAPTISNNKKIPSDVLKSPFELTLGSSGNLPVLTVGKLGDWHGPTRTEVDYPVMAIDTARDVFLNIMWQSQAELDDGAQGLGFRMWVLTKLTGDDFQADKNSLFNKFNINPVGWASRYTRTQAIAYATSSVVICQQALVQYLQAQDGYYSENVTKKLNKAYNLDKPTNEWDGFIWPFDLFIAIAQAIGTIHKSKATNKWKGVFIVETTKHNGDRRDWNDQTSIDRIKMRIKRLMKGLPTVAGGIPSGEIDGAISKYLHFKRTYNDNGEMYSHSKIVCVDEKLMYVGSDNAYPCYNEEHGVWIEDKDAVGAWLQGFFEPYWIKHTTEPADEKAYFDQGWKILAANNFDVVRTDARFNN